METKLPIVASPDGCPTMSGTPAKLAGDQPRLTAFLNRIAAVGPMNATIEERGPRRTSKSVRELAERYYMLQQLRRLVHELEQCATKNDQSRGPRGANENRCPK
jgi:hypothetical protein